eukprot:1161497-Pelagomonas_calceolata.AAC.8
MIDNIFLKQPSTSGQCEASALLLGLADGVYSGHITQEQQQVLQQLRFLAPQALAPSEAEANTAEQPPPPLPAPPSQLPVASTSGSHQHEQLSPLPNPPLPILPAASTSGSFQRLQPQPPSLPALAVESSQPLQLTLPAQPPRAAAAAVGFCGPIDAHIGAPAPASPSGPPPSQALPAHVPLVFHATPHGSQAEQRSPAPAPPLQLQTPKESSASVPAHTAPDLTAHTGAVPPLATRLTPAQTPAAAATATAPAAPYLLPSTPPPFLDEAQTAHSASLGMGKLDAASVPASVNAPSLEARVIPPQGNADPSASHRNQPGCIELTDLQFAGPTSMPVAHSALPVEHPSAPSTRPSHAQAASLSAQSQSAAQATAITAAAGIHALLVQHQGPSPTCANNTAAATKAPRVQTLLMQHQGSLPPSANAAAGTVGDAPGVQALLVQHQVLQQELLQLGAFVQQAQQQGPVPEGLAAQLHSRQQMLELQVGWLLPGLSQLMWCWDRQHMQHGTINCSGDWMKLTGVATAPSCTMAASDRFIGVESILLVPDTRADGHATCPCLLVGHSLLSRAWHSLSFLGCNHCDFPEVDHYLPNLHRSSLSSKDWGAPAELAAV